MTSAERIAKAVALVEDTVFNDILDYENYGTFSDKAIECKDDYDDGDRMLVTISFKVSVYGDEKEFELDLIVDVVKEKFQINQYEDTYEDFESFDHTVQNFWRVLFFKALE